jgi:DNA-directed RNA polymerase subunit RPC12/RpoP
MKIEATCDTCGRKFLLAQIGPESDAPGRCPFCGARFGRHYTTVLVESAQEAEVATARFIHAIRRVVDMETGFHVDLDSLLQDAAEQIRSAEGARAAG